MEAERFDALSRLVGSRTSRRMAVALAATGLLGLAMPDVAEARCSTRNPCPDCKKCRKRRCKPDAEQDDQGCTDDGICKSGTCCLALQANCTDAEQCCQGEEKMACGPIGNLGQDQCCRPLGGACSTVGSWEECCTVLLEGGGARLVDCAPTNTCGGWGASCNVSSMCASGVCCRDSGGGFEGVCCNAGQFCVNNQCVG